MNTGVAIVAGAGALVAVAAFGVRWLMTPPAQDVAVAELPAPAAAPEPVPTAVREPAPAPTATEPPPVSDAAADAEPTVIDEAPVDVASLGREPIDDERFEALAERLRRDPALLAALIDEARTETDPERLRWLLLLLGEVDDPSVVALATELAYGADPALRTLGLDLLKRLRPGDPDVLSVVSTLLASETDEQLLVPTLTALARPGNVDGDTRATLAGQVALLVDHPQAAVRRISIDILSRWSQDATYTPQLLAGLDDPDERVRETAAFAFVDHEDDAPEVRRALFALADDGSATEASRRGAVLALKRMALEEDERARVLAIERRLDTR